MSSVSRNRGVRASRVRLYHALIKAGLKTQTALAERMADLEGLDAAPKDLVNRVFRELPVELHTLERVAAALGTDAVSLYMTSKETGVPRPEPPDADDSGSGLAHRRTAGLAVLAVVFVAMLGLAAIWMVQSTGEGQSHSRAAAPNVALELGRPSVLVMPLEGDHHGRIAPVIRERLAADFAVATGAAEVLVVGLDPAAAAGRLRADLVLDGEVVTVGRFGGVRVYLFADGVRRQIWAESAPVVGFGHEAEAIAERIVQALHRARGASSPGETVHFPLAPVQDNYLEGRFHLDRPASELNLKRAQSRFEAALRQDANYARAHAGLCEALLEEHWMADEQRALEDAARACGQAIQLDPLDPLVQAAHAHFLRLTGRLEESIEVYEQILARVPDDAGALAGLAFTRLQKFRGDGDPELLAAAMEAARAAADADPGFWKPPFFLAIMKYFSGNLEAAVRAGEEALARDENEMILANLGTLYFCSGDLDGARDAYLRAGELAPHSYVGDEFLGMVYYYLEDYEESARLRRRAIESVATGSPEMHQMWGNLADAYRQAGDPDAAAAAYVRAIEIVERDLLRGTAAAADRAARAWYYTVLDALEPGRVPDSVSREVSVELQDLHAPQVDPAGHLRMAQTWLLRNDPERAQLALESATATCTVFARMPDLVALHGE